MCDRADDEILLTTSEFKGEQLNDFYYREIANTLGKPGSFYAYDRNKAMIKQAGIDGVLEKVVPTSSCSTYCTCISFLSSLVTSARTTL